MELLQLRYFYDSAINMNISKTAEKYTVPPTSVSASIKRLESELGCKLFDRYPNKIILNDNGKIMFNSLKTVFSELDKAVGLISNTTDDTKEIRILVKAIRSIITEQIVQYKYKNAKARFKLVADFDETSPENYDIIIDTDGVSYPNYDSLELCRQRILIYASANSHLKGHKLKLSQLSSEQFANLSLYGNHYQILNNACKEAGFTPNLAAQVNDSACFMRIISSGVALGVAGELYAKLGINSSVVPLDVIDFKKQQIVCMYYKNDSVHGSIKRFINFLVNNINNNL